MMEEELIKIWQSSNNQERIKFERSRLMIDVQSSVDRFHQSIKYRDLREIIVAIALIPIFGFIAYDVPFTLSKIGAILIVFWLIFVIIRLRSVKKIKPSAVTETYLDYLYKTRAYLNAQKRLLDSVLYWYILPSLSGLTLFLLGFMEVSERFITTMIIAVASAVVVGIAIYFLNKKAVKKEIIPRLEEADKLIKIMEE